MKQVTGYLAAQNPIALAAGVALVIGVVYLLSRQAIKETAAVAAGVVSGNNAITQNQTDFDGNKVSAYEGRGVLGTLGAATNSASGGTLASVGGYLGSKFYDLTHLDETQ
jgi:hypothetical protein